MLQYQHIDHELLSEELFIRGGDQSVVDALTALLSATGGRSYGLPQQSRASNVLAEAFLDRLERAMVRRGLRVSRYNDDFRFSCRSWSEVIRAVEVLSEEARRIGLTVNVRGTILTRARRGVLLMKIGQRRITSGVRIKDARQETRWE